ncbi:hypothetical protein [Pseudoalteromonas sp. NZS100]|uniref:hypothetical protein n=1 Tax=Pseudoalteromonas sp. NZS100 TaxID=2792046 RepID=UPI0018CD6BF1|nr:hypothetical protein [Pseudoalteromonas sp. NZS100]MBH0069184.1 hypothetical protein [Pseudoalteromonas sp. NZS100]
MSAETKYLIKLEFIKSHLFKLCAALGLLIIGATIVGQIRFDRFPAYQDLLISAVIPFAGFAVLLLLFWMLAYVYPTKVSEKGIKCCNLYCVNKFVSWDANCKVYFQSMYGLPYICLLSEGSMAPLTIPCFMKDFDGFAAQVARYAGESHELSKYLASHA